MNSQTVIDILNAYFASQPINTRSIYSSRNESININEEIFKIQHHLALNLNKYQINLELNPHIYSDNIMKSFKWEAQKVQPYSKEDYETAFYFHIVKNYSVGKELRDYIEDFIELNKEKLRYTDIVITETGATRCKTNIRFSVDTLRKRFLLLKRSNAKRSLLPTIHGLLFVASFLELQKKKPSIISPQIGNRYWLPDSLNLESLIRIVENLSDVSKDLKIKLKKFLEQIVDLIFQLHPNSDGNYSLKGDPIMEKSLETLLFELEDDKEIQNLKTELLRFCKNF
jgi:hypothetical protein